MNKEESQLLRQSIDTQERILRKLAGRGSYDPRPVFFDPDKPNKPAKLEVKVVMAPPLPREETLDEREHRNLAELAEFFTPERQARCRERLRALAWRHKVEDDLKRPIGELGLDVDENNDPDPALVVNYLQSLYAI